jgi:hypothetical protein
LVSTHIYSGFGKGFDVSPTTNGVRAKARTLNRLLIEERERRIAAELALQQTSIESAARSDALYLASYLVETSAQLAELASLDGSTVRQLILKSPLREQDMEIYRAAGAALEMVPTEREYGPKMARKLLVRVRSRRGREFASLPAVAAGVALATRRMSGAQ